MNKNLAMLRKVGGLGLAGALVFGAAQTQAEEFTVTTDVQNTLAITVVQGMNLGTLFAASAASSTLSSLTMDPDTGTYDGDSSSIDLESGGAQGPSFVSLGGEQPAIGSVATGEPFTISLPGGTQSNDLDSIDDFASDAAAVDAGNVIEVSIAGGDPGVARFYLADFTIGGETADSNPVPGTAGAGDNGTTEVAFTPGFGVNTVEFAIGATVYTDGSGTRTEYEAGTYEGSFEVTASF